MPAVVAIPRSTFVAAFRRPMHRVPMCTRSGAGARVAAEDRKCDTTPSFILHAARSDLRLSEIPVVTQLRAHTLLEDPL